MGAAEDDLGIGRPVVALQRRADAVADLAHLVGGVRQLVDAVHEDHHLARADVRDQPDQRHVHRGQRLVRRQDDDADAAVADRADRDLLAHHEGVVHAGRVPDAELHRKLGPVEQKVGRLGDVGEASLHLGRAAFAREIVAEADVAFDQRLVEALVVVLLAEQELEPLAEARARLLAHPLHLAANLLQFGLVTRTFGQFADAATLLEQAVPFGLVEESEGGAQVALVERLGRDVERRDDRGPRVDVRGQESRPADHRVDERGLAGLHLPDHRDRGLEQVELRLQLAREPRSGLVPDPAQILESGLEPAPFLHEALQPVEPQFEEGCPGDLRPRLTSRNSCLSVHVEPANLPITGQTAARRMSVFTRRRGHPGSIYSKETWSY
jgi:hypothetical protein